MRESEYGLETRMHDVYNLSSSMVDKPAYGRKDLGLQIPIKQTSHIRKTVYASINTCTYRNCTVNSPKCHRGQVQKLDKLLCKLSVPCIHLRSPELQI